MHEIRFDQVSDLILRHNIEREEPDAAGMAGVCIVNQAFVYVVGKIHSSWLPASELVVNQIGLLSRVLQRNDQIILLTVVVREDCLLSEAFAFYGWEERPVVGLVTFKEEGVLDICKRSKETWPLRLGCSDGRQHVYNKWPKYCDEVMNLKLATRDESLGYIGCLLIAMKFCDQPCELINEKWISHLKNCEGPTDKVLFDPDPLILVYYLRHDPLATQAQE